MIASGTRIQLAEKLLAEIRIPDRAVGRADHVVRLRQAIRDVVLRDDDVRRRAFEPRKRLERPLARPGALIDARQELRQIGREVIRPRSCAACDTACGLSQKLWIDVSRHARQHDVAEFRRGMIRVHDPLQRVARGCTSSSSMRCASVAGHADHPLAVGDLIFEIFRRDEPQVVVRRFPGGNRDGRRAGKIVAGRANAQPVGSRRQVRDGEAVRVRERRSLPSPRRSSPACAR